MKKLILPICAVLAVTAAVLVVVYYRPGSQANKPHQVARNFDANANGAQSNRVSVEPAGRGPQVEGEGRTERQPPAGTSAEQQERKPPQTDTGRQSAATPDTARERRSEFGGPGTAGEEGMPDRPAMRPGRFMERFLEAMDTDGDGKISKAEWRKHYEENFDQADKNSDGYIDSDEMSAGFRPPGGMGPGGRRRDMGPGPEGPPGGNE